MCSPSRRWRGSPRCGPLRSGRGTGEVRRRGSASPRDQGALCPRRRQSGRARARRAPSGCLTDANGHGPFPAVALLHSCLGLPANRQAIADALARQGYVALFVDDFAARGLRETCAVDFAEALPDAYGALAFLSRRVLRRSEEDRRRRLVPRRRHGAEDRLVPLRFRLRPSRRGAIRGRSGVLSAVRQPGQPWPSLR